MKTVKPPPRLGTRDRLVHAARELFWERGYVATGVNDILERAQARSGSFYHFFESKEALLNAVLDLYVEGLHPEVVIPATRNVSDPVERVFAILTRYRELLLATDCTYGCPIGRLALELPPDESAPMARIALNLSNWCAAVEGFLKEGADRFPPGTDCAGLSRFVLTVMEGAVLQARAHRSIEPFDDSVQQLREYVRLLEAARRSSGT